MANTGIHSNNRTVVFRGEGDREMPSKSQAQNRFMHAAAAGNVEGVSPKVGKEFVKADKGRKIKKLPGHVRKAYKSGLVSDKAIHKMRQQNARD
jgi:hypothetical protein